MLLGDGRGKESFTELLWKVLGNKTKQYQWTKVYLMSLKTHATEVAKELLLAPVFF